MAKKPKGYYSKGKTTSERAYAKANARKSLTSVKGIASLVGLSVLEGLGGPKAKAPKAVLKYATRTGARILTDRQGARIIAEKAARTTRKTSDKVARAAGREAAGPKAKGPGGRPQLTRNNKSLKGYQQGEKTGVAVRTGNKSGQFKNTERVNKLGRGAPERVATATEKEYRAGKVNIRYESPKKLKAAAQQRKDASRKRLESTKPTGPGKRATTPKPSRPVNFRLRKSNKARLERSVRDYVEKYPGKGPGKLKSRTIGGQLRESTANAPVPKAIQERVSRSKALKDAENRYRDERGLRQPTIDSRSSRPRELTEREIEILRKVGKRDYSRGEVNTLAQSTVQREADDLVAKVLRDPRVRAQDAARVKAAIEKAKQDKSISRTIKGKQKNFRGKPMKK